MIVNGPITRMLKEFSFSNKLDCGSACIQLKPLQTNTPLILSAIGEMWNDPMGTSQFKTSEKAAIPIGKGGTFNILIIGVEESGF